MNTKQNKLDVISNCSEIFPLFYMAWHGMAMAFQWQSEMTIITTDVSAFAFKQFQCQLCMIVGKKKFSSLAHPHYDTIIILNGMWTQLNTGGGGPVIVNIVELCIKTIAQGVPIQLGSQEAHTHTIPCYVH